MESSRLMDEKDVENTFNDNEVMDECESLWLLSGPPFDQRDYMISPSGSLCTERQASDIPAASRKLVPCDIKIDPKYVLDSQKALRKLVELIRDGTAENFVDRLKSLLLRFLGGASAGFHQLVEDLPLIIEVTEYFARNHGCVQQYQDFVRKIVSFSKKPPVVRKRSDNLHSKQILEEYFTLLGELLATFDDYCFQLELLDTIDSIISRRNLVDVKCVKLSICNEAMENSQLPYVISSLIETVSPELFIHYLEVALQMFLTSLKVSVIMVENNVVCTLLCRLSTFSAEEDQTSLESMKSSKDRFQICYSVLDRTGYLIWGLLLVISKYKIDSPCPGADALWSLKTVFLREARKNTTKGIEIRNTLAALMIKLAATFGKKLPLIQTDLAVGIAKLAVYTEIGVEGGYFKLGNNSEDFRLKKLLMLGCCLLAKHNNVCEVFKSHKVIEGILKLIANKSNVSWDPSQYLVLLVMGFRTLSEIVPVLPEEFVNCDGNKRLIKCVKFLMNEHFNQDLLLEALKTFCTIITSENNTCVIEDVKNKDGVKFLLELCFYLLEVKKMKIKDQEKLSRVFIMLEKLLQNDGKLQEKFAEPCVTVSLKIFERILANLEGDSKWKPRLFISFGSFLWEAVAWCPSSVKLFVGKGGIFLLLDFIEMASFPLQMFFLGILVDMTDEGETIAHLLTWRGSAGYGILNTLIDIWRREEYITKVHRTREGFIEDLESPLMTEEQWYLTHRVTGAHIYSPSIAEMVCSARPKIHALYQFLQRRYFSLSQISEASYHIQLRVVKPPNTVYIPLIEHYLALKMGEVWFEVLRDASISGVCPTSFDGELLCTLISEKNDWASRIKTMQEEILLEQQSGSIEEESFYNFLKTCRLPHALEAVKELDYMARTTYHRFQKQTKQKQINNLNNSFKDITCNFDGVHRTFTNKTKITVMDFDTIWIKSEEVIDNSDHLTPVSPESSRDNIFETNF